MRFLRIIFVVVIFILGLSGCGGSLGGDVGTFTTVYVDASVDKHFLDADVSSWQKDTNGDCTVLQFNTDTVTVSIDVNSLPNLPGDITPSPVRIESITVSYLPATEDTPPLSSLKETAGMIIAPGGTGTIEVDVMRANWKANQFSYLIGTSTEYRYYVTISINAVEIYTGERDTIKTGLNLNIGDYISEGECRP